MTLEQLNDDSLMTVGRFRGVKLSKVPPYYFLSILKARSWPPQEGIKEYIESNIERIMARKDELMYSPPFYRPCKKKAYMTQKIAENERTFINQQPEWGNKLTYSYECKKCGYWHHTSKPLEEFDNKVN